MSGWKVKLGAGLSIFFGVASLLLGTVDAAEAARFIADGVIALGIGHKIDKLGQ